MNLENNLLNNKYGCYICGGMTFLSKFKALEYANQINSGVVRFYYHDHIWDSFDKRLLGKIPLTTLYKERAQQLRDKYDHLVLHYSGGADSHNVLHTFLVNNIKLDEVSVRWAKPLRDGKFYTPNNQDTSASNAVSEWDFAIKPTLDKLRSTYPEIKITIVDFTDTLTDKLIKSSNIENRILELNMTRGALFSLTARLNPKVEQESTSTTRNKSIGHIFGIDKPIVNFDSTGYNMCFQDAMIENTLMHEAQSQGFVEFFYWAPDFPILPMEQSYQIALKFKSDAAAKETLFEDWADRDSEVIRNKIHAEQQVQKYVLYKDSWNLNTFQAGKPNAARSDWYFWLHNSSELVQLKNSHTIAMKNLTSNIDSRMLINAEDVPVLIPLRTKFFNVL
jgi:hypothetical protein